MDRLTLALWAVNMAAAPRSLDEVASGIDARLGEAAQAGARFLVLPEYVSEQWLAFAPPDLPETEEVRWMGERGAELLETLRPLPARHGVALLPGTWPARSGAGWVNRAHLMLPDGRIASASILRGTGLIAGSPGGIGRPGRVTVPTPGPAANRMPEPALP